MSEPVLQVKGLKTYYYTEEGVVPAVDGLDFEVEPGETFVDLIYGLADPRIRLD